MSHMSDTPPKFPFADNQPHMFSGNTDDMSPYGPPPRAYASDAYALSGKIMLSAIIILFFVVVLIVGLHIYARWFLTRSRRRQQSRRRRHRRTHLVFTMDVSPSAALHRGLDAVVLKSLPTFNYSAKEHDEQSLECAVCLSEFEDNERGRLLPKCNHSFHTECIDMWFKSHSTCPLCRAPVTSFDTPNPLRMVIDPSDLEGASSTAVAPALSPAMATPPGPEAELATPPVANSEPNREGMGSCSSSSTGPEGARRKVRVSIEVPPRRHESFKEDEAQALDSLGGRIRSFTRMLSRDRRPAYSPRSCGSGFEIDLERGAEDEEHTITPRTPNQRTLEALNTS